MVAITKKNVPHSSSLLLRVYGDEAMIEIISRYACNNPYLTNHNSPDNEVYTIYFAETDFKTKELVNLQAEFIGSLDILYATELQ